LSGDELLTKSFLRDRCNAGEDSFKLLVRGELFRWPPAADLAEPLYERMKQRVLSSFVIHTDDTSVKLLDFTLHQARTARFWAYIGDGRNPYSVYDFTDSRSRDGPQKFLQGFSGYLQADAYGGYDGIYLGSRGGVLEVACWAHCRRYWWHARDTASQPAHRALSFITRLYQLEHEFAGLDNAARTQAR
jgi:transposase